MPIFAKLNIDRRTISDYKIFLNKEITNENHSEISKKINKYLEILIEITAIKLHKTDQNHHENNFNFFNKNIYTPANQFQNDLNMKKLDAVISQHLEIIAKHGIIKDDSYSEIEELEAEILVFSRLGSDFTNNYKGKNLKNFRSGLNSLNNCDSNNLKNLSINNNYTNNSSHLSDSKINFNGIFDDFNNSNYNQLNASAGNSLMNNHDFKAKSETNINISANNTFNSIFTIENVKSEKNTSKIINSNPMKNIFFEVINNRNTNNGENKKLLKEQISNNLRSEKVLEVKAKSNIIKKRSKSKKENSNTGNNSKILLTENVENILNMEFKKKKLMIILMSIVKLMIFLLIHQKS